MGVCPETKHPTSHAALGLPLEDRRQAALAGCGYTTQAPSVVVRPFEFANLQYLRSKTQVRQVHQGQWAGGYELKAKGSIDRTSPYDKPCDIAWRAMQAARPSVQL